jgi:Circadian oscillating protein COP23
MKKLLISILFLLTSFPLFASSGQAREQDRFFCNGSEMKAWNSSMTKYQTFMYFMSQEFYTSGYTEDVRCNAVAGRLNNAVRSTVSQNNEIKLGFKTGRVNRLNVICLAKSPSSPCRDTNMIITLSPIANPDPELAVERFVDTLKNRNLKRVFIDSGKRFFPLSPLLPK